MATRKPPPAPGSFELLTAEAILAETDAIIESTAILHERLAAELIPATATFANLILPIVDDANQAACRLNILSGLLAALSPDSSVRQAARQAEARIAAASTSNLMQRSVAMLIAAVYTAETRCSSSTLDAQDRHLLRQLYGQYARSGALLSTDSEREHLRAAKEELASICAAAQDTMVKPEEGIWYKPAELAGVPEHLLATMTRSPDGDRVQITFRKDHRAAVMRFATCANTRRQYTIADWNRFPENVDRLARAIVLRDKIARALGFEHHVALGMETKMAPNAGFVKEQLDNLHARFKPIALADSACLLEIKRKDPNADSDTLDAIYSWDTSFYLDKQKKASFAVDHARLAEYFEAQHTFDEMLALYCDLFGLEFRPVTNVSVWHSSVIAYEAWDAPSEGGSFIGYMYADLFVREGKYRGGAYCDTVAPHFIEANGTKHYPAVALICSYAAPSLSAPALLQHGQVVVMFHELGHAIHDLVSRTKYNLPRPRDYSEIPSHMLENWTWIPDVLVRIGKHYASGDALPRQMAEDLVRTRTLNSASAMLSQVHAALFDLEIHSPQTHDAALHMDTTKLWNDLKCHILPTRMKMDEMQSVGAGQARFIHMFRHNDAGYFSYPLSMAYAADIFQSTFAADPMNAAAGRRWRYQVLEKGASMPEMEILKAFLGRAPTTSMFC